MENNNQLEAYQILVQRMIVALDDMTAILAVTDLETLKTTVEDMAIVLPRVKKIPTSSSLEAIQKTTQNLLSRMSALNENSQNVNEKTRQEVIENMVATSSKMINILEIKNGDKLQITLNNVKTIIPEMIQAFFETNWTNFEPEDEDVNEALQILNHENLEELILNSKIRKESDKELNNSHKVVLLVFMLLYYTVEFVSDTSVITLKELKQN